MLADMHAIVAPLPWQEHFWEQLVSRKSLGQLPHGLLLRGAQGTGKGQFGLALAQLMLCAEPSGNVACGRCKSCQLLKVGSHPDILMVEPEEVGKAIKIEQIRQVLEFSSKSAQFGGYRVILISPAEAMNVNASNALLKCLEEPGKDTLLILVSHQISGVLATIRSRCQSLDFPIPDSALALPWLQNIISDQDKAQQLLQVANGAPLTAVQLNDRDWLKERDVIAKSWSSVFLGQLDPVKAAEMWQGYALSEVLGWLIGWFIDYHRFCAAGEVVVKNPDLLPIFRQMANRISQDKSQQYYDYLLGLRAMINSQANPNLQLLVEDLLIRWSKIHL